MRISSRCTVALALLVLSPALATGPLFASGPVSDAEPAPGPTAERPPADRNAAVEHLAAFARLYGTVRFFHPSDEAALVDWDRFAVYGAGRVMVLDAAEGGAVEPAALLAVLEELFEPIAPTLRIDREGSEPTPPERAVLGMVPVYWQHEGVDLGNEGPYRSVRVNRPKPVLEPLGVAGAFIQGEELEGHRFRLSARVRARPATGGGNGRDTAGERFGGDVYIAAVNASSGVFLEKTSPRPIAADRAWERVELTGTFEQSTLRIGYGVRLHGQGEACFDDLRLEVQEEEGDWRTVELINAGFEDEWEGAPALWTNQTEGYRLVSSQREPFEGERAGCIESVVSQPQEPLFDAYPRIGEMVDEALGAGLRVRFPLMLELPPLVPEETEPELAALLDRLVEVDMTATAEDQAVRVAAVTIAWNVLQHFYPYFDVVDADWDAALTEALAGAVADETPSDLLDTLRRLVSHLEDGHASAFHRGLFRASLDIELAWVDGEPVVLEVGKAPGLEAGDVIETIDGRPAARAIAEQAAGYSGSPQWRRKRALWRPFPGAFGASVELTVRRGGERLTVSVARAASPPREPEEPAIHELRDGIFYVDLSRAALPQIEARIEELAAAKGVVFDLRGYPKGNHDVLRHLSGETLRSAKWNVPRIIYPNRERIVGWSTDGRWTLEPKEPQLTGEIVFLTDASAISYAESVMGIVEHYRLGAIVGEATAGANGNVNPIYLPGGFTVNWTGMKVLKHDDSQHHLIGIQPTVPAGRTVEGIRAGRDEQLERALALIEE